MMVRPVPELLSIGIKWDKRLVISKDSEDDVTDLSIFVAILFKTNIQNPLPLFCEGLRYLGLRIFA